MRTHRIFSAVKLKSGTSITLSRTASRHVLRVLRLQGGETFSLFDGHGGEHLARISETGRDLVKAELLAHDPVERESALFLRLLHALPKGEKADWIIQKATELGANEIHLLSTERTVVRLHGERAAKRLAHWQAVAINACEQCGRNRVPDIGAVGGLAEVLRTPPPADFSFLLHPAATSTLTEFDRNPASVNVLIGPEGGFTESEVRMAARAGFTAMRFGPRILRTETAAISVLSALQVRWGDIAF